MHEINFNQWRSWAKYPRELDLVEELLLLIQECYDPPQPHWRFQYCWTYFYDAICSQGQFQDVACLARLFRRHGAAFQPFYWDGNENMAKNETLLKLYLETGGDPNIRDELGRSPLLLALWAIKVFYYPKTLDQQPSGDKDLNEETPEEQKSDEDDPSYRDYQSCINLIVMLISAGADIYELDACRRFCTLCDRAAEYKVYDIMRKALSECGLNADDVCGESHRRQREIRRKRGAIRTGVDIHVLDEDRAGLRLRGSRRRDDLDP
jgi:hypothetical protein